MEEEGEEERYSAGIYISRDLTIARTQLQTQGPGKNGCCFHKTVEEKRQFPRRSTKASNIPYLKQGKPRFNTISTVSVQPLLLESSCDCASWTKRDRSRDEMESKSETRHEPLVEKRCHLPIL